MGRRRKRFGETTVNREFNISLYGLFDTKTDKLITTIEAYNSTDAHMKFGKNAHGGTYVENIEAHTERMNEDK